MSANADQTAAMNELIENFSDQLESEAIIVVTPGRIRVRE